MMTETKKRYEVRYEDSKGFKWRRGKESGLYEYEDVKYYVGILKKQNVKNIKIVEVTEIYKVIENCKIDDYYEIEEEEDLEEIPF